MPTKREKHTLEVLDSVWVKCSPTTAEILGAELSYEDAYWIQGQYGKEKKEYTVTMINKVSLGYVFYTGFLQRSINTLKKLNKQVEVIDNRREVFYDEPDDDELRDYQKEALLEILEKGSGIVHHATGTGKSYIINGVVKAFSEEHVLFLVHTKDLMWQISDLLNKGGIEHSMYHSSAGKNKGMGRVTVTTVQTYAKVAATYFDQWDVLLIDETHHINAITTGSKGKKKYSQYAEVLLNTDAPIRYGFTATLPSQEKQKMCLEALIGPVHHSYTMQQASEDEVLAKGEVEFLKPDRLDEWIVMFEEGIYEDMGSVKDNGKRKKFSQYQIVYYNCITTNTQRTIMAIDKAYRHLMEGESVLILTSQKKHIEEFVRLCALWELEPSIVDGSTKQEDRNRIKKDFNDKVDPFVIASSVWNEGVSIDTIDVCINAGGGLDEKRTMQIIGRGLRKSKHKNKVKIYDFEDTSHRYLRKHTEERKKIYKDMGWM